MEKNNPVENDIERENKIAELLEKLFVNRYNAYGEAYFNKKTNKTAYKKKESGIHTTLIKTHIRGDITIGIYQLNGSRVKWGCLDFDENTKEDYANVKKLYLEACKLELNPLLELSGGGKYKCHIWFFGNCEARDMKHLLEELCNKAGVRPHEIFPKQEQTTESSPYGNLVKLPLALHLATKKRSTFLNDNFEQVNTPEAIEELLTFHLNNIIKIPEMSMGAVAGTGRVVGARTDKKLILEIKNPIKPEKYNDFFNFVLKNELPAGVSKQVKIGEKEAGINNNILKNLGIWLFKMGCTYEDLKSEIKPVYDEKRWSFGDLMGWYNKAKEEVYDKINHGELILWCNNYYPNLRKLLPKTKLDDFYEAEFKNNISIPANSEIENAKDHAVPAYLSVEVQEKFKDINLLENIKAELSKTHIGDDKLKMTTFLCGTSGLLKNPKRRSSIALKGDSSTGKDNNIKTTLRHMPISSFIFLTSGTQAVIEDDLANKRIIGFSEVNKNRDDGANKHLTEIIKQKAEGGTSSMKKDKRTDMKTARHDETEQACVLYGTTEADKDEELGTRFIEGTIQVDVARIKAVNNNTLETFSDPNKLLNDNSQETSWIRQGLTYFFNKPEQFEILLPYAGYLKEQIDGQDIFDNNSPRSQRDIKRLLSLTCATTYLFQEQRKICKINNQSVLISEPIDFINTLEISADLFNQSYSGIDSRLTAILSIIGDGSNWIARDDIEKAIGVSKNTIKKYCNILAGEGLIEGEKGVNLSPETQVQIYNHNKIYYRGCQKGIKRPLITCQISKLKTHLESKTILNNKTNNRIDEIDDSKDIKNNKSNNGVLLPDEIDTIFLIRPEKDEKVTESNKIDTSVTSNLTRPLTAKDNEINTSNWVDNEFKQSEQQTERSK